MEITILVNDCFFATLLLGEIGEIKTKNKISNGHIS